ncbi:MAG TPA: hypothetical protein VF103_11550, partial [Polyangiaceae bacterium]
LGGEGGEGALAGSGGDGPTGGSAGSGGTSSCEGCTIDGTCYADGTRNPSNDCEICDPGASSSRFSPADDVPCDDGKYCTIDDRCEAGTCNGNARPCSDGVACNGEETCSESAQSCVPGTSQCPSTAVCNADDDRCVEECQGCTIQDTCYAPDAVDPNDACRVCDPARSTSAWSGNDGAACDDEAYCTVNDHCAGTTCTGSARGCGDGIACNGAETCSESIDECVTGASPCDADERCNTNTDHCDPIATCGNSMVESGEACDDGVNDGAYGGCMPGCATRAPRCGDGTVNGQNGETCDGNCPTTCTSTGPCDTATLTGSGALCTAVCNHTAKMTCTNSDSCCPANCTRANDNDCTGPTFDVEVWADNTNRTYIRPTSLQAPYNSYARIRWHNIGSYELWIVNFGSGTNWSQLAILPPGAYSSAGSTAEGPWCAYDFGGTYHIGALNYPTDERAVMTLQCVR